MLLFALAVGAACTIRACDICGDEPPPCTPEGQYAGGAFFEICPIGPCCSGSVEEKYSTKCVSPTACLVVPAPVCPACDGGATATAACDDSIDYPGPKGVPWSCVCSAPPDLSIHHDLADAAGEPDGGQAD